MRPVLMASLVFLSLSGAMLNPVSAAPSASSAMADVTLKQGVQSLLGFVSELRQGGQRLDPRAVRAFMDQEIAPYFDFAYMARYAAGGYYPRLSLSQRRALERRIQGMFLSTLARNLVSYRGQEIRYFAPRPSRDGKEVDLRVWITQAGAPPVRLKFRLYHAAEGWKVFDVIANGVSALNFYRRQMTKRMRAQATGRYSG